MSAELKLGLVLLAWTAGLIVSTALVLRPTRTSSLVAWLSHRKHTTAHPQYKAGELAAIRIGAALVCLVSLIGIAAMGARLMRLTE